MKSDEIITPGADKGALIKQNNLNASTKPSGFIAKLSTSNAKNTSNRLYGGYNHSNTKMNVVVDYSQILRYLSEIIVTKYNINDIFFSLHNLFTNKLNCNFTALGVLNLQSSSINLKIMDKIGNSYSSRVSLSNEENPVTEAFLTKKVTSAEDNQFLKMPYLLNSPTIIFPLFYGEESLGVFILGDYGTTAHFDLYTIISHYISSFVANKELTERAGLNNCTDALTNLCNHRKFQEILSNEIKKSQSKKQKLSIVIFDINNISQINRELSHAKGDEIIKIVADKLSQNIRSTDTAGRYGGDEIGIIMPGADAAEAKYLAEYLMYSLSCCLVDDIGPIRVSVGIATYPDATVDQEKLLILAEQAMCISKSKGFNNGVSAIVCSSDYDFWDDVALSSFASVLLKRHTQIGINFEEELVNKFNTEEIISQNHLIDMVTSLAAAIDAKDGYTKGHSTSVSRYSEALARAINLPEKEVERIRLGALLHDVGKIGIPENILKKPSNLTDDEFSIMKAHPVIGAEKVLMPNPALHDLIPIVKYHHEHYNGTGYPERLKGEQIPLAARIVAIGDAYHALISDRPYRKGLSIEKACEILQIGSGIQWDKELVRQFITIAPSLGTKV